MSREIEETWVCELCGERVIMEQPNIHPGPPLGWSRLLVRVNSAPTSQHCDNLFLGDICGGCRERVLGAFSVKPGFEPEFAKLLKAEPDPPPPPR